MNQKPPEVAPPPRASIPRPALRPGAVRTRATTAQILSQDFCKKCGYRWNMCVCAPEPKHD